MINITIWSDFACPYCYIGETRLFQAINELNMANDVMITYRAFELDPSASKDVTSTTPERYALKYHLSPDDAKAQIQNISDLGRELGIDFRYMTTQYSNTRDAHRLMKMAEARYDHATVVRLNEALFRAYFVDNLILADHHVLINIAMNVGIDEHDAKLLLDSDEFNDEVRLDEREAAMRGIHGVPYILFDGSFAIPGAMSTDGFKSALMRARKKHTDTSADASSERPTPAVPTAAYFYKYIINYMIQEINVHGIFYENCYVYIDDVSKSGFIIDPGAQAGLIYDIIKRNDWHIERILLTHGHFDHMGAAEALRKALNAPIYIFPDDARYLSDPYLNLSSQYGSDIIIPHYEELSDGEIIRLTNNQNFTLQVIHTPGHTPGSVTYYAQHANVAFVGDTLYEHYIGLTNFPGGDDFMIQQSINKIMALPGNTTLLSGHSSAITVAEQRRRLLR